LSKWVVTSAKYLTESEAERLKDYLYSNANNRRGKVTLFIIMMLIGSGLRAQELCDLSVNQTPVGLGEDALSVKGKGGQLRHVWILPELSELIRWYVAKIRLTLVQRPMLKRDHDQPLLLKENGKKYDRFDLYRRIRRTAAKAGIAKRVGVHTLRHTYGTGVYRRTQNILLVKDQLGHKSLNTTTVYSKLDDATVVETLKKAHILTVKSPFSDAVDSKSLEM